MILSLDDRKVEGTALVDFEVESSNKSWQFWWFLKNFDSFEDLNNLKSWNSNKFQQSCLKILTISWNSFKISKKIHKTFFKSSTFFRYSHIYPLILTL